MIEVLDAVRATLAPLPVLVRCVLAFAAFMAYLIALDWVIAKVLGRENSMFRS